jgi:hypothetical protein
MARIIQKTDQQQRVGFLNKVVLPVLPQLATMSAEPTSAMLRTNTDVHAHDTVDEPGSAPAASSTIMAAVRFPFTSFT